MNNKKPTYKQLEDRISKLEAKLAKTQWLQDKENINNREPYSPSYGDVTELNTERTILDTVGKEYLEILTSELMDLLDTSVAIYEKNGGYAYGVFNSSWCQLMDASSRNLCNTNDNKTALNCGKWLCHDDCWNNSAKPAIISKKSTDIDCPGGIRLFAEPIFEGSEVIGVINIGYGNPPTDDKTLKKLSEKYSIDFDTLKQKAKAYNPRPDFIIEIAKKRLKSIAQLIGEIVSHKTAKEKAEKSEKKLNERVKELNGLVSLGLLTDKFKNIEDIYKEFIKIIVPNSMQFSDKVYATLEISGKKYCNIEDYKPASDNNCLFTTIKIFGKPAGTLTVTYIEKLPFIEVYEQNLINAFGDRISKITERIILINDLRNAKEKAEESEENLRFLYENMTQGVVYHKPTGEIIRANEAAARILGLSLDQLYGKTSVDPHWKSIHEDGSEYPGETHPAMMTIKNKKPVRNSIMGVFIPEKNVYSWININSIPQFNDKNELTQVVVTFEDITEIRNAKEKLEEANATKDRFISILGHDLRSPFNTLLGFSDLLIKNIDIYDKGKIKKQVQAINKTAQQTFNLLNNLLEWSRSQQNEIPFNPQTTNLYFLINETYLLLNDSAEAKQISIELDVPEEINAKVDSEMIKTVIRNLLSNAIKFTSEQGKISVSASKKPEFIQIEISDTGTGMDSETLNSLFKIGKTESKRGTKGERGTGFGLLLCKEFVEKHGGKIWAESDPDGKSGGKGSDFKFTLPTGNI